MGTQPITTTMASESHTMLHGDDAGPSDHPQPSAPSFFDVMEGASRQRRSSVTGLHVRDKMSVVAKRVRRAATHCFHSRKMEGHELVLGGDDDDAIDEVTPRFVISSVEEDTDRGDMSPSGIVQSETLENALRQFEMDLNHAPEEFALPYMPSTVPSTMAAGSAHTVQSLPAGAKLGVGTPMLVEVACY